VKLKEYKEKLNQFILILPLVILHEIYDYALPLDDILDYPRGEAYLFMKDNNLTCLDKCNHL
jgi:hypothetical protein